MFLDHMGMVFVLMGFILLLFPLFLLKEYVFGWLIIPNDLGAFMFLFLMGLFGSLYLNKDCIRGRAPGKRLMLHVIVNYQTNEVASPVRCLIRSVTMFLLSPIEVVVILFSPNRRIGDYIAGTEVVNYDETIKGERDYKQIMLAIAYGIVATAFLILVQIVWAAVLDDTPIMEHPIWNFIPDIS